MHINDYNSIDITKVNKDISYLHYTNVNNLSNIFEFGLEPRIGINSIGLEKSPKVFFTIGFDNMLVLMDAWIKWIVLRPKNNFVYRCGVFFMTKRYFPKFIVDTIFSKWINNEKRIKEACKTLNYILNDSVFLILDLEENIDFKYDDIDEVKNQKFSRKQLEYIYNYNNNTEDFTVENWNMHTLSNKTIEKEKIRLLKIGELCRASELIKYMVEKSNIEFHKKLPFLDKYIKEYIKE